MTDTIKVRAVRREHASALSHPGGPALTKDGVLWPYDGLTCRLLAEKAIERVPDEQPEPAAPAKPLPAAAPSR